MKFHEQNRIDRHIGISSGVRSGKPCVSGTRITVADIVLWTERGLSPDELLSEFSQLSLASIHAALSYYHDNRTEVDRQIEESCEFVEDFKTKQK